MPTLVIMVYELTTMQINPKFSFSVFLQSVSLVQRPRLKSIIHSREGQI